MKVEYFFVSAAYTRSPRPFKGTLCRCESTIKPCQREFKGASLYTEIKESANTFTFLSFVELFAQNARIVYNLFNSVK